MRSGNLLGKINRPNLIGALFIKSVALENYHDLGSDRHLQDFGVLSSMLSSDDLSSEISKKERIKIINGVARLRREARILHQIDGAEEGLQRIEMAFDNH